MQHFAARFFSLIALCLVLGSCNSNKSTSRPAVAATAAKAPSGPSFYSFTVNALEGGTVSMETFKGKKIIVLNVASKCGYTPQYADWQAFYEKYKDKVIVLGFPCNQFMGQEPGDAGQIQEFCSKNYGVTFPMFEKLDVKGSGQAPLYQWLSDPAKNGWNKDVPSWNFCKYLINEKGDLMNFFASGVTPESTEFKAALGI